MVDVKVLAAGEAAMELLQRCRDAGIPVIIILGSGSGATVHDMEMFSGGLSPEDVVAVTRAVSDEMSAHVCESAGIVKH